jgi:carbon dioxide concentrating mechanism protein CcmL
MMMAKVVGTVIPNRIADGVASGRRWLLIESSDQSGKGKGEFHIALDMVEAGPNEFVLICQGSAARQTPITQDQPVDAVIVGIIDMIDQKEKIVYQK